MPDFFLNGIAVSAMPGESVLAASQRVGAPLATVCKGRGICGACRVVVENGLDLLEPPSSNETRLITYLAKGEDPQSHRLGCQILVTDTHSGLRIAAHPIIRKPQQETAT